MKQLLISIALASVALAQNPPAARFVRGTTGGSANAYTLTPTPASTSYTGMLLDVCINATNTAASTINVSSLGTVTVKKPVGGISTTDVEANDLKNGSCYLMQHDGTNFQVLTTVHSPPPLVWFAEGGGSPLTAWVGKRLHVRNACVITEAILDGDVLGSVTVVIEKAAYTTGTPSWSTISSSFATSSVRSLKSNLSGWTTAVEADSLLRASITGTPATTTNMTISLRCN